MSVKKRRFYTIQIEKNKHTYDSAAKVIPVPDEIILLVPQYPGDMSKPVVEVGSYVVVGQKVADSMDSMPVHSAVSGTVEEISEVRLRGSDKRTAIRIVSDGKQKISEKIEIPEIETRKAFIDCLRRAGILSGSRPAYMEFNKDNIRSICINGLEPEPVVTAVHRMLLEDAEDIVAGAALSMKYLEADRAIICISEAESEAMEVLSEAVSAYSGIIIKSIKDKYIPDDNDLIKAELAGSDDNDDILFTDVRAVAQIGGYFRTGMPVISQKITVDGDIINEPGNVLVPIGMRIADIVEFCGGYKSLPRKIIDNGTMSGRCFSSDRLPVSKETKAVIAFEGKAGVMPDVEHCIRCGNCYRNCPKGLPPVYIAKTYAKGDVAALKTFKVSECIGCGCCSYICPAKIPLHQICLEAGSMIKEVEKDVQ